MPSALLRTALVRDRAPRQNKPTMHGLGAACGCRQCAFCSAAPRTIARACQSFGQDFAKFDNVTDSVSVCAHCNGQRPCVTHGTNACPHHVVLTHDAAFTTWSAELHPSVSPVGLPVDLPVPASRCEFCTRHRRRCSIGSSAAALP